MTNRLQITDYRLQIKSLIVFSVLCSLFSVLSGCQSPHLYKDSQAMMGTFVEVISPDKEAGDIVFKEIKRIEDLLSKYQEDSEVVRLNRLGSLKVSPDTFYILQKAKEFWQLSNGLFDVSVGPLMDLWGFTEKKYHLPRQEEINNALKMVGFDKIIFNPDNNVVKFKVRGMKIDLGAIAKGYAVDCAVKKLKEYGIKRCLVNAGGQIYCLGDKFGKPWRIAVRHPRKDGIWDYLELKDRAVSTCGDYEQYFIKGDKRYNHILNPRTGYPIDSGIVSATVIAHDGLTADALATSIFVLGKEKGEALAKKFRGVEVKIIEGNE